MSASLVGSEMCIRDSRCALAQHCTEHAPASSWCKRPAQCMLDSCMAVSYTHLTLPTICSV
eukprot:71797-Alexandrium_andersonii.AAC.1